MAKSSVFAKPFMLSLGCHGVVFSLVTLTLGGGVQSDSLEFFFWGSIIRKTELAPVQVRTWDTSVPNNVLLSQNRSAYSSTWGKGIAVDKTDPVVSSAAFFLPEPQKFSGPKVSLDDAEEGGSVRPVDLPAPPRIRLRYPRP